MLDKVDHIAIAVADLDEALAMYETVFAAKATHRESIDDFGVEIATIAVGDTAIELIAAKSDDSPIHKFVAKNGPGLHHVAYAVPDIEAALQELTAQGVELIDKKPRRGKENSRVAFIHPRSTGKVLYELVQLADG